MINTFELTLLNGFRTFWKDLCSKVGLTGDLIPEIFAGLPATGDYLANQKAIGELCTRWSTGDTVNDLSILLQFPTAKAHFPCVSIEVGQEQEVEVIGSFVGSGKDDQTGIWEEHTGGPFEKAYSIGCYSFNADSTLYLFSIVKYGLLLMRDTLEGPSNIAITVRPMQMDFQRFSPDVVYFRYIDIRVEGLVDTVVKHYDSVVDVVVEEPTIDVRTL